MAHLTNGHNIDLKKYYPKSALIVTQSPWGNVDHYQRLAEALPIPVWGLEHAFLRSGLKESFTPATLEEAARQCCSCSLSHTETAPGAHVLCDLR